MKTSTLAILGQEQKAASPRRKDLGIGFNCGDGRIRSLLEMIEFLVPDCLVMVQSLERVIAMCDRERETDLSMQGEIHELLQIVVKNLRQLSSGVALSPAMCSIFASLEKRASKDPLNVLSSFTRDSEAAFIAELQSNLFLCLSAPEAKQLKDLGGHPKPAIRGHLKTGQ